MTGLELMAVEVKGESTFEAGVPRKLFALRVSGLTDTRTHYAPSADGQRFLVNTIIEEEPSAPIAGAVNWLAGLRK